MRGYSHGRRKTWPLQGFGVVKEVVSATVVRFPLNGRYRGAERVPRLRVWSGVQTGHSGAAGAFWTIGSQGRCVDSLLPRLTPSRRVPVAYHSMSTTIEPSNPIMVRTIPGLKLGMSCVKISRPANMKTMR